MAVTAALVKELRERTGAGMMECKKALVEANADIELAIENMRKSGAAKAAKKAGNVAAEGAIIIKEENGVAVLLEVNCQTDFVAKDGNFTAFAEKVAAEALTSKATVEALVDQFEEERVALVAKIGENINIRRVAYIEGTAIASYRHGEKIGVVVVGSVFCDNKDGVIAFGNADLSAGDILAVGIDFDSVIASGKVDTQTVHTAAYGQLVGQF